MEVKCMSIKFTWFGHNAIGLEINSYQVIVDPFFDDNPAASIKSEQIKADFILISHGHSDHLGDTLSIAKRNAAQVICNSEIAKWLGDKGLNVHAQQVGGGFQHPFGHLKLTNAEHSSSLPDGCYGGNPAGFLITADGGKKIYLACDTGLFGDMRLIGEEGITFAALPIGDNFTMGPEDAIKAVKMINPRHVVPVHYNTWDIIKQDAQAWCSRIKNETDTAAHLLQPEESLIID